MRANGRVDKCMPHSTFWAPITAQRFLDLQDKGGKNDEYFSMDYTEDDELRERLGHCFVDSHNATHFKRYGLVAFLAADEYVPDFIADTEILTRPLIQAMNTNVDPKRQCARSISIPDHANHNLSQLDSTVDTIIAEIHKLLQDAAN